MQIVDIGPRHILYDQIIGIPDAPEHEQKKDGQEEKRNQQNACHDGELGRQVHILDDPGDLLKCASQHKLMPAPDRTYGILSV